LSGGSLLALSKGDWDNNTDHTQRFHQRTSEDRSDKEKEIKGKIEEAKGKAEATSKNKVLITGITVVAVVIIILKKWFQKPKARIILPINLIYEL
jgi:hypothetical protein